MTLNNKQLSYAGVAIVVALLVAFAGGRFSNSEKKTESIQTAMKTDTKQDLNVNLNKDQHVDTITTETKKPDGTIITTTEKKVDTVVNQEKTQVTQTQTVATQTVKESISRGGQPVTVQAMVGADLSNVNGLIYGLSVSKPLLGPVAVGIWGLTNKTAGFSLGLQF